MKRICVPVMCLGLAGCETLDATLYQTSMAVAPPNPVTGQPNLNLISEEKEIQQAREFRTEFIIEAGRHGIQVDPPGPALASIRKIFRDLVAVAHRQQLPWEVHLVAAPDDNAFTPGGGLVFVFQGLLGGLVPPGDAEALAAVLAHEIAHVALRHASTRETWSRVSPLFSGHADDPYYMPAFTTDQEAEADRLSVLYLALAGIDPLAASRLWAHAHGKYGSSAARARFLHTHPLPVERLEAAADAGSLARQYWLAGQQNPRWQEILEDNVLLARSPDAEQTQGAGFARALDVTLQTMIKHNAARASQRGRERAATRLNAVLVVAMHRSFTPDGRVGLFLDVRNQSKQAVTWLAIGIHYFQGQQLLGTDSHCQGTTNIPAGGTERIGCYQQYTNYGDGISASVLDAAFQ